MNGTNNTNVVVTGSGTASDPITYNFHTNAQSYGHDGTSWMFYIVVIIVLGFPAAVGFLLGFYFGKSRKKSN
jgi:ABC-type multidrug transport system permease subunit